MSWAETLKGFGVNYTSNSHTTNIEGEPPLFEHVDRTRPVYVSYADMKVIRRNGTGMKVIRRNGKNKKI